MTDDQLDMIENFVEAEAGPGWAVSRVARVVGDGGAAVDLVRLWHEDGHRVAYVRRDGDRLTFGTNLDQLMYWAEPEGKEYQCESCWHLFSKAELQACPSCGRGTCEDCRVPSYADDLKTVETAFDLCRACFAEVEARGGFRPL